MADAEEQEAEEPKKKGGKGLMMGLLLAVGLGGGGFFATYTGIIGGSDPSADSAGMKDAAKEDLPEAKDLPPISFVALDPIIISIGGENSRHLRFRAEIEVVTGYESEVDLLKPRILDVLNTYLRAVDSDEFERPGALLELRSQMLRRIQIVTGEGRVRDLLIAEFVVT